MIDIYEDILDLLRQDNPLEKICEELTEQINEADKKFKIERLVRENAKKLVDDKIEHCSRISAMMGDYFSKFYPDLPRGGDIDPHIIMDLLENSAELVKKHNALATVDPGCEDKNPAIVFTPDEGEPDIVFTPEEEEDAVECGSGEEAIEDSNGNEKVSFYGSYESYEKIGDEPAKIVKKTFTSPAEANKVIKGLIGKLHK